MIENAGNYRVYFCKDGDELVILLGGGSKKRQSADITAALACRRNYMGRKHWKVT
jgi:putative addiction module killer protein